MTVEQLIRALQQEDPKAPVRVLVQSGDGDQARSDPGTDLAIGWTEEDGVDGTVVTIHGRDQDR